MIGAKLQAYGRRRRTTAELYRRDDEAAATLLQIECHFDEFTQAFSWPRAECRVGRLAPERFASASFQLHIASIDFAGYFRRMASARRSDVWPGDYRPREGGQRDGVGSILAGFSTIDAIRVRLAMIKCRFQGLYAIGAMQPTYRLASMQAWPTSRCDDYDFTLVDFSAGQCSGLPGECHLRPRDD